jgi:hypothetical protein
MIYLCFDFRKKSDTYTSFPMEKYKSVRGFFTWLHASRFLHVDSGIVTKAKRQLTLIIIK